MTSTYTQENRPFKIETPLGTDVLILVRFEGEERVSSLFQFVVEVWSERDDIKPTDLLLQPVTLKLQMANGSDRLVKGIVSRLGRGADAPRGLFAYTLEIVPKHWVLTQDTDYNIWQEKSWKEICNDLLLDLPVEWKVQGHPQPRPYTFRYRESSWQCTSRLMEQYGAWYCFDYNTTGAKLVVADTPSAFTVRWDTAKMSFGDGQQRDERLLSLSTEYSPYIAKTEVRTYSEHLPTSNITSPTNAIGKQVLQPSKVDDYHFDSDLSSLHSAITHGGGERGDAQKFFETIKQQSSLRQQLRESTGQVLAGTGTYAGLQAGGKVDIANHTIGSYNGSYVVLAVRHSGSNGAFYAGDDSQSEYQNSFELIPEATPYRPPRVTPWPVVSGSLVGVVVGPPGEEIHTDKYGRVQVCFRWDRESNGLERSCWIRVAQPWAGMQYGAVFLPRIGHEVLVEFLEGDPDNPIVVGSLYNAANMPPYALPANKTQNGIKTRSSLNGTANNYNELRFEDKKGSEQINVQAEKNLDTLVKNDETRHVGHNRTTVIVNQDEKTVNEADDITTVKKGKQLITVEDNNREIKVKVDQIVDIGANEKITVADDRTLKVGKKESITVGASRTMQVGENHTVQVDGEEKITVKKDQTITITDGNQELGIKKGNTDVKVDMGNIGVKASMGNVTVKADLGKITLEALQSIELKVGANSIKIDQTGITVKGIMVKVEGSAMAQVKAPMTQVNGDAMLMLKGGITMIN